MIRCVLRTHTAAHRAATRAAPTATRPTTHPTPALVYLASPYTHDDPAVRQARYEAVCRAAAEIVRGGQAVFSPIAHSHALCQHGLPLDWPFWRDIDLTLLRRCDVLWVLATEGWAESVGVRAEIDAAREHGLPVHTIDPTTLATTPLDTTRFPLLPIHPEEQT